MTTTKSNTSQDLIQPGAVVRIPRGKIKINVQVVEVHNNLGSGRFTYFTGRRIRRDSKALRSTGWTVRSDKCMYALSPSDDVTLCTDQVLANAVKEGR